MRIILKKKHKKLYYLIIFSFSFWILLYFYKNTNYRKIEESTWECYGDNERSKICEFTNFCIDRINGPFIITKNNNIPKINLINAENTDDMWFSPKIIKYKFINFGNFIDKKLFVYGLYSPFHFSHFLYNGLIPLYSTILDKTLNNQSKIWLLRGTTFWNKNSKLEMDYINIEKDIVLDYKDVLTNKQILPPYIPICFSKAIVGTGNKCSLWYCENQIKQTHYKSFRENVFNHVEKNKNSTCFKKSNFIYNNGSINIGILNRNETRHITNLQEVIKEMKNKIQNISIKTINFDKGCSIKDTSNIVKDLDILVAPFGNGLGSGLFMKENTILISIDSRWYSEDWFHWPMTSIGRRIYNFECTNKKCQENDIDLLENLLNDKNITLNDKEKYLLMTKENPYEILTPYLPGNEWSIIGQYRKNSKRKIDVNKFIDFLKDLLKDYPNNKTYIEICKDGKCCKNGDNCKGQLERNIYGINNSWK